jgi:arylsulfatase A-like enzyme
MRIVLGLLAFCLLCTSSACAAGQPNFVFILADDMGVGDVSHLNPESRIQTPNIDSLADSGISFLDAHTSASVCTPTRYSFLTGRYNWRSPLKERVLTGYSASLIESGLPTIASMLKENGYRTAMIGKWHLGLDWQKQDGTRVTELRPPETIEAQIDFTAAFTGGPVDHGFDYFFGINASLDFPPYVFLENDRALAVPTAIQAKQGERGKPSHQIMMRRGLRDAHFEPQQVLKTLTGKAVDYINNQDGKQPFFLYVPLNSPHTPVVPREEFLGSSKAGIYGDFIQETDWTVGRITAALREKGLLENTILVFTADNGASRASFSNNMEKEFGHKPSGIYRGRKAALHEGGHRVPLVVSWPKRLAMTGTNKQLVVLNDFYATMADIVGDKAALATLADSFSLLPIFEGEAKGYARTSAIHHDFIGRFSFREGPWKLILNEKKPELFNLANDPSEKNNLLDKHPDIVAALTEEISRQILNGRSTPGPALANTAPLYWEQLYWLPVADQATPGESIDRNHTR